MRRNDSHCSAVGCASLGVLTCQFKLRGNKADRLCSRCVCEEHAKRVNAAVVLCPPHARVWTEHRTRHAWVGWALPANSRSR